MLSFVLPQPANRGMPGGFPGVEQILAIAKCPSSIRQFAQKN